MSNPYYQPGTTQEDVDRAAGGYDEGYYCSWCEDRVDDEHECPGNELDNESEE